MAETTFQADYYPITRREDLDVSFSRWIPTALSRRPYWTAAIRAYARELAELEDALYQWMVNSTLENALGFTLERWGDVVGEQRLGLDDPGYRRHIQARVRINHSDGSRSQVARIFSTLTGSEQVFVRDEYPANVYGFAVVNNYFTSAEATRIGRSIQQGLAGGIGSAWVAVQPGGITLSTVGAASPGALSGAGLGQRLG